MYGIMKKIFDFAGTRKGLLKKSMVIAFIGALFSALQFSALMVVIDAVLKGNKNGKTVWISLGIMLISILGRMVSSYFSTLQQTETGYHMVAEKRIHIGDRLRYIPMGYFNENSLGNITAVVTTTLGDVENSAARCLVAVIGGFLNSLAFALMLLIMEWRIGLVILATILLYLAATELSQKHTAKTGPARQRAQESLVEAILEYLQGMGVVKAFGLNEDSGQTVNKRIDDSCEKNLKVEYSAVPWMALQQLVTRLGSVAMTVLSIALYINGSMELSRCLLMLISAFLVFGNLESAGNMSALLQMMGASMDKANMIDDTPVMDIDGEELTPTDTSVSFKNVTFSYDDRKILDNVNLTIPQHTTTAVVGPSGGGKTTLCNLIARFWDVQNGSILLGGHDVREYKLDSLMSNISMVFQNVYLFNDTIENNIKFGKPDAAHEQVIEAAKSACCHEFIMQLPDGYDTMLGEGGGNLSGGEKQRISIARAMLKNSPVVILDEATASVDPENEAELQRAIEALTHEKTIIMIAHRLKTVRNADQILVLAGGHIVQRGTHDELAGQEGVYAGFLNARKEAIGWKVGDAQSKSSRSQLEV